MVAYGSDYLLGLSTFTPEAFAARDRALAAGDVTSWPATTPSSTSATSPFGADPAYKHAAAQFLHLVGAAGGDRRPPARPAAARRDRLLLFDCARRLDLLGDPERIFASESSPTSTPACRAGDRGHLLRRDASTPRGSVAPRVPTLRSRAQCVPRRPTSTTPRCEIPPKGSNWRRSARSSSRRAPTTPTGAGRALPSTSSSAGDDVLTVAKEAYALYQSENALGPMAFPSLKQMEADVVGMGLSLLHAPDGARAA